MSVAVDDGWTALKNEEKGRFRGYSKNTVSGRAERQGKARAWNQSRKVKRGRTRLRYARKKKRGNVRPKMRRQLGAGGSRAEVSKDAADINAMVDAAAINELVEKASEEQMKVFSLGGISPTSPLYGLSTAMGATDITQVKRPLRTMEFFSGMGGDMTQLGGYGVDPYRRGAQQLTTDYKTYGREPTWTRDIMEGSAKDWADRIIARMGNQAPDVMFASPTCVDMSTTAVGTKWETPLGYGPAMKREAMEARKHGEAPSWMGESTDKRPFGNWKEVPRGTINPQTGRKGTNQRSARLFKRTFDIATELLRHKEGNPDMYVMIENPLGLARYMPFTYSKDLPDMANIQMASYTNPASSVFGIAPNVNPVTLAGIDPLSSSLPYATQSEDERLARQIIGAPLSKPEKRTDIFGRFPKSWMPRPRVGEIPGLQDADSRKRLQELIDSGVRFSDISMDPRFRGRRPYHPDFVRALVAEQSGFRNLSPRQLAVNAMTMQPAERFANIAQLGGTGAPAMGKSPFAGVLYPIAPAGSARGTQGTRGFTRINPVTGERVRVPAYNVKSVIPDELGADFSRAAEKELGILPPIQPETQYHLENPNDAIRRFLDSGGINTVDKFRKVAGDSVTDWLESQGYL